MKVKNKDVLILIKKIEKYFKVNSYIDFENIKLDYYTIIDYNQKPPERIINKKIIIPIDNEKECCINIKENSKKVKNYQFFYNKKIGEGIKYNFEDLEKEVTIPEILNAYQSLLNLKALKIEHF